MTTTPDALLKETDRLEAAAARPSRKPYPEYRDSGVEWLEQVPAHWTIERLKWTASAVRNGIWGSEPDGIDDIACVRVADFDRVRLRVLMDEPTMRAVTPSERKGRVLSNGDLLLEKSGGGELQPVGAVMLFDHDIDAVCSNFVARVVVATGFDPRFVTYLHAHLYGARVNTRSIKQTTGIQNLDGGAYFESRAAWPSLPEQQAIAAFLDRKTREIDALIEKKRRLIDLLQEKRTALISHAVTKGLNPDAPMKPSGVEWLGEVPEHWEVVQIRRLLRAPLAYGVLKPDKYDGEDAVPIIRILDVESGVVSRASLERISPNQSAEFSRTIIRSGEVVVSVVGTLGRSFIVSDQLDGANLSRALARVQIKSALSAQFLNYYFQSAYFRALLEAIPTGTAQRVLNLADLRMFSVAVPSTLDEQLKVVDHLECYCMSLDHLVERIRHAIDLLIEFRQALISAAVTGKIDVREEVG